MTPQQCTAPSSDPESHQRKQVRLFQTLEVEQDTTPMTRQHITAVSAEHYSSIARGAIEHPVNGNPVVANGTERSSVTSTSMTPRTNCDDSFGEERSSSSSTASTPIRHLILPSDTLAGLCLTYKVSPQALQRANTGCCVSSDGLRLTVQPGDYLVIPSHKKQRRKNRQDVHSREYKLASVLNQSRHLTTSQAERYLEDYGWNVQEVVRIAQADQAEREQREREHEAMERQRKRDGMEIQRILRQQYKQTASQVDDRGTNTELTRLTTAPGGCNGSGGSSSHGSVYLDQPADDEEREKEKRCDNSCLMGCCSCVCLVIFEWIRLSIHIA